MNVVRRSKDLKALLDIRTGPGAAILPASVKRIHLEFAIKYNRGHFGARKLWREHLPRLKYLNPAISMTVSRHGDQSGHSKLTIFFTESPMSNVKPSLSSGTPAKAPESGTWERVETIDMKHKHEAEILQTLLDLTQAESQQMSEEEQREKEEATEDRKRREKARRRQDAINERARLERALLQQARENSG